MPAQVALGCGRAGTKFNAYSGNRGVITSLWRSTPDVKWSYKSSPWHVDEATSERWLAALETTGVENVRARLAQTNVGSAAAISIGPDPSVTVGFAQQWLAWCDERKSRIESEHRNRQIFWTRLAAISACVATFTAPLIAQRTLFISNRAWIAPRTMKVVGNVVQGREINFGLTFGNPGREPALRVSRVAEEFAVIELADMDQATLMEKLNSKIEENTAGASCKVAPRGNYLGVIYPAGPEANFISITAPEKFSDERIASGVALLVVRGCFSYETMGTIHHSGFCFYFNALSPVPAAPGFLRTCTTANEAD